MIRNNNRKLNKLMGIYLQPKERIALEMIVLDSDKNGAVDFLSGYGLKIKDYIIIFKKSSLKGIFNSSFY